MTAALVSGSVYCYFNERYNPDEKDFYGTFRFGDDNEAFASEYVAVIPGSDSDDYIGKFIIYNDKKEVLSEGECGLTQDNILTFSSDGKGDGILVYRKGSYCYIGENFNSKSVVKINDEPVVP